LARRACSLDTRPLQGLTFSTLFLTLTPVFTLIPAKCGAVAQLGERLNGIQEVVGSIPIGSTTLRSGTSELRVASHFFRRRYMWDATPFESEGCPPKPWRRGTIMKYVYLLQSLSVPTQRYVGVTANLEERLRAHNAGASSHTSKYRPWKIVTYLCFQDDRRAAEFERYLKTGSGQAFANKRLW
jgi:putative endonuclease